MLQLRIPLAHLCRQRKRSNKVTHLRIYMARIFKLEASEIVKLKKSSKSTHNEQLANHKESLSILSVNLKTISAIQISFSINSDNS